MKRKGALEEGYCTAPLCRKFVKFGDGNQWIDEKGELERFCWKCWQGLFKKEEERHDDVRTVREGNQ